MEGIKRDSPVSFEDQPAKTKVQDNWRVIDRYEGEGSGPHVVDLSHRTRWDLQDRDLSKFRFWGTNIPETPGHSVFKNGILINRMNRTQASIWHLSGESQAVPDDSGYTEVTEATVFLALLGREIFSIMEKLTSLDFKDPYKETPFLLQGPISRIPCQAVTLGKNPERSGILFTFSRGYARDMLAAILRAGAEFELHPAGETAFNDWIGELSVSKPMG